MIFNNFLNYDLSKIKKIVLLNNFPSDLQNNFVNQLIEELNKGNKEELNIHRIYDDINIKILNEYLSNIDLFSNKTIFFIYNFTQNLSSLKKLNIPSDIILFIFTDEKQIEVDKNITIIQFPKSLDLATLLNQFLNQNKIKFESKETEEFFKSFFNGLTISLEKVCEDVLLYLKKINSDLITKDIALQFLSYSPNFSFFSILNSFFQKDKLSFFYQYMQFIESENDFNSFFQPFLKEIKILTLISSIMSHKLLSTTSDKNLIISYFNKIKIQYNPYRYQYDLRKLENFGKDKLVNLLEFLLSIEIYSRYYDKQSAQKLFEIGINQFI